jgi:hypothetical protein
VTDAGTLFGIDDQYLYFRFTDSGAVGFTGAARISKTATKGTGTILIDGRSYSTFYGPVSGELIWLSTPYMSNNTTAYQCDVRNCAEPSAGWRAGIGPAIGFTSEAPTHFATIESCAPATCINWWSSTGLSFQTYEYTTISKDVPSRMAAGDYVYWIGKKLDVDGNFVTASLYRVEPQTLSRAQLAGGITESVSIVDVNEQSVLLYDRDATSLLRVPLPLGLGNGAPAALTIITGGQPLANPPSATEDAGAVYWIDQEGTLSKCSPSDCVSTTKVLANAQNDPSPLFQDSAALYWSHSNYGEADSLVRLAK